MSLTSFTFNKVFFESTYYCLKNVGIEVISDKNGKNINSKEVKTATPGSFQHQLQL